VEVGALARRLPAGAALPLLAQTLFLALATPPPPPPLPYPHPTQRIVELQLRDLQLGGVALSPADRERFNEIQQELAQVGARAGAAFCLLKMEAC
jgi:hypothetical protein